MFKKLGFEFSVSFGGVYRIVAFPKNFMWLLEIHMAVNDGHIPYGELENTAMENTGSQAYEALGEFKENCAFTKVPYLRRYTIKANKLIKPARNGRW